MAPAPKRCGGAVNVGYSNCGPMLWDAVGSRMPCYAYGGPTDACALTITNDIDAGIDKDPSACNGDTFFLWDEPGTQGKSYEWAAATWLTYSARFATQLSALRNRGVRVTTPLVRADNPRANLQTFWTSCGAPCSDTSSPAYIDIVAANPFCGSWNQPVGTVQSCRNGANFVVNGITPVLQGRPLFMTNWGYLGTSTADAQIAAIDATEAFFSPGSPVERVYWFGAIDYGGGTTNNFLTSVVNSGPRAGVTLGTLWAERCASL
ncbi:MAG: hypothetical protein SGPRY_005643 [Prymnesium sp.]